MKNKTLMCLLLTAALLFCTAQSAAAHEQADRIIYELRDIVFQQDLNDDEIKSYYDDKKSELNTLELSETEFYYYNAMMEYWLARSYQSFEKAQVVVDHHILIQKGKYLKLRKFYTAPDDAIYHYEKSLDYINEYIDLNPDYLGYHQYSEIQAELILLKPVSYVLAHGLSVKKTLKKSIELNPDYPKALIADGASDIYTPPKYGGEQEEGIRILKNVLDMDGVDREDFFNIYTHIAYGLIILDRHSEAIFWLEKAKDIYPGNIYLSGLIKIAEEGINP